MKTIYDLSQLEWKLSGWTPYYWRMQDLAAFATSPNAEITTLPAKVPGSVKYVLKEQGLIPDWNVGLNGRQCEWIENRHWLYEAVIPREWIEPGKTIRLRCLGLDYSGWVYVNGSEVAYFKGAHIPHVFDLTPHICDGENILRIVFDLPPRWLGQFGFTEEMKDWKARFNYTWDWVVRLVQIGIWDDISLELTDGREISEFRCYTDVDPKTCAGAVVAVGRVNDSSGAKVRLTIAKDGQVKHQQELLANSFNSGGINAMGFEVDLWWPNLHGPQPLYDLNFELLDADGAVLDSVTRRVGFKKIEWAQNEGAPEGADPWICVVNGKPIFLQGANWVPVLPNFADVTEADYRKRVELYKDLGFNVFRIWGGANLEKELFYNLCDEAGIMIWQEFPLSSSGGSCYPPDDAKSVEELAAIAESYVFRRQHHASLLLWSGGNELTKYRVDIPADLEHPTLKRFSEICARLDPTRRFIATSPTGPSSYAHESNYGKGLHWDVHGPWKASGSLEEWENYWKNDDSLFRSETGAPGASSAEIIRKYAGDCQPMPATWDNPYWRRGSTWWIEWPQFCSEMGREPNSLEEYVAWSQERQKKALVCATRACKSRFPKCGGIIFWMGHDCFPCTANTAIIDFEGNPKPAALAIAEVFREQ